MRLFIIFCANILCTIGCFAQNKDTVVYAHRGFRGLSAENTIPAMKKALRLGADVLEMDIAFSADNEAIVTHDPWMDSLITLDPHGMPIAKGKGLPFYKMDYASIRRYDVGLKQHTDFPNQQNFHAYIPRLAELIDSVEHFANVEGIAAPRYSIETKTSKARDGVAQPAPEEFVKRLMAVILSKKIEDRVIIQSFDVRTLEIVKREYPTIITMLNVSKGTLAENLSRMTFQPDYYAPIPALIDDALFRKCRELGIRLLCGNVNDKKEIDRVMALGVYEYCTDYPYGALPKDVK